MDDDVLRTLRTAMWQAFRRVTRDHVPGLRDGVRVVPAAVGTFGSLAAWCAPDR